MSPDISIVNSSSSDEQETRDNFDSILHQMEMTENERSHKMESPIHHSIRNYEKQKPIRNKQNSVFEIINDEKYDTILRPIAQTLSALPVTQVSCERLFSLMTLIFTDWRSHMKPDLLQAILIIKANDLSKTD